MPTPHETTLKHYEKVVAAYPDLSIKGKASSYTSMNGHMFSFITKEGGFALRLPKAAYEAFMKKHRTKPVIQYGATMREYVDVPMAVMKRPAEIAKYFQMSVEYIASLPPKPTTRAPKKKAKKRTAKKASSKKKAKAAKKSTAKKAATKKAPQKKAATKKSSGKKKSVRKKTSGAATSKAKATKKATAKKRSAKK